MLRFVIGVDKRIGTFGAEIERMLRRTYDIAEFEVLAIQGNLPIKKIRDLASQVDCILEGIYDFPAHYHIGLSSARVILPSPAGPVPTLVTVITAINPNGEVVFDCIERIGHYLPEALRGYGIYRPPDLLDVLHSMVLDLVGTHSEPLPSFA